MVKVKMSLENYNKFLAFIGKEWVDEKHTAFINSPNSIQHPLIKIHSATLNSQKFSRSAIPKEIYMNILLMNFQKYNFIGSFIERIEEKLPNPTRFKNDLQNPDQYENTLFELITFGILTNSNYNVVKKDEEEGVGNPDFYIKTDNDDFTVECTRCNTPGDVEEQSEYAEKFKSEIEEYFNTINYNSQIYLTTHQSLKDEYKNLVALTKEVLDKKETGVYEYCNNSITLVNTATRFTIDEEHEINDFTSEYPLYSMLPSNLGSSLLMEWNQKKVKNVREISLNFEKNVYRKIRSTLLNKITKIQSIEGISHYVFLMIPLNFTNFYDINDEKIKEELLEILNKTDKINSVFIIYEKFYKDENDTWAYRINWNEVENDNASIVPVNKISLNQFDSDNYIVEDNGLKKEE